MAINEFTSTMGLLQTLSLLPIEIKNQIQLDNWEEYQKTIENRLNMFSDNWEDLLIAHIRGKMSAESKKHYFPPNLNSPLWPIPTHANLLKRAVEETSLLYKKEAIRSMAKQIEVEEDQEGEIVDIEAQGAFEQSDRYREIVDNDFNILMSSVNELVNATNVVIVLVSPSEMIETKLQYTILTPDMFVPIQHPDEPSQLIGLIYTVALTDTVSGLQPTRKEVIIYMGTGKEGDEAFIAEVSNQPGSTLEKQPYPFTYKGENYLPFAVFRKDFPQTGEFVNRTRGEDLYNGTLNAGWLISQWLKNYQDSTGKQVILIGRETEPPKTLIRDSMAVMTFPLDSEGAELDQIEFNMDLKSRWESVLQFIESVLDNYGLSIERYKAQAQSGLSIRLQNESLRNVIEKQWPFFRSGEKDLAIVTRKVNNSLLTGVEGIPDDYEFSIDFGQLPFDDNPLELWDVFVDQASKGIMNWGEVLLKFDPDIGTQEDAIVKIRKNLDINRELQRAGFQATSIVNVEPVEEETETPPENPLLEEPEVEELEEEL
jgi:hypothetical protein